METLSFKARIYQTGINWCVDVPRKISKQLVAERGYIRIKGKINGFEFTKAMVPVKDKPYRLFVNLVMMKGGNTSLGKIALFEIRQGWAKRNRNTEIPIPAALQEELKKHGLEASFQSLPASRRKDILKYLSMLKKEETLMKNVNKVITQLKAKQKVVRVP